MNLEMIKAESMVNFTRYQPGQKAGHYESFFQRANHPTRPLAFWIRYTIFSPDGHPENAIAEIWTIFFNGETSEHVACKSEWPIEKSSFDRTAFQVKIGSSILNNTSLTGKNEQGTNSIEWELKYSTKEPPLFLLPLSLYDAAFPKAKALVAAPLAIFDGHLKVNSESFVIDNWLGSQNHNWGSRHTDKYAWGQVSGFDNAEQSFFEIATAQVKLGPVTTPAMTIMVVRHEGKEYAFNSLTRAFFNKGDYDFFEWSFKAENDQATIEGLIAADADDFVGLNYYNPPGGSKTCLNSKIAKCDLTLSFKNGGQIILKTSNRAAFEILTERSDHGIKVQC